jgi:UDP-N-acetylmuramoyl-L-alanyl-D-glutamate--2,6-diaminopimelate ligase
MMTVKEIYKESEIILVIGSQGGKDKSKRKYLGMIADKYAKEIILTSEDPKDESLIDIIFDISIGIINANYTIELNRKNAIEKALKLRKDKSVILIVGKGMEESEKHKNKTYSHSDYECVLNQIKNQVFLPDS